MWAVADGAAVWRGARQVLELTLFMADVNAKAIENNRRVMETNEEIVAFNQKYIMVCRAASRAPDSPRRRHR